MVQVARAPDPKPPLPRIGAEKPVAQPAIEPKAKPEPKPQPILKKHASWPREVWVLVVYGAGIATGVFAYDVALNRGADATTKAVIAGQAIERAGQDRDAARPSGAQQRPY